MTEPTKRLIGGLERQTMINTSDVVKRLRSCAKFAAIGHNAPAAKDIMLSAADTIERLRAELAAKVPEGYVVVPVEPTEAMVEAFIDQKHLQGEVVWQTEPEDVWSAMIAAAEGGE